MDPIVGLSLPSVAVHAGNSISRATVSGGVIHSVGSPLPSRDFGAHDVGMSLDAEGIAFASGMAATHVVILSSVAADKPHEAVLRISADKPHEAVLRISADKPHEAVCASPRA